MQIRIKQIFASLSHFSVELLVLVILMLAVGTNLALRTNSRPAVRHNQSLFFIYLKNNPNLNEKLVEFYESVNLQLTHNPNLPANLETPRQILAASSVSKEGGKISAVAALPSMSGQALLKPNPGSSSALPQKRDVEVYKVRGGDTVARIASAYGVSVNTILNENNLTTAALIKPDQELRILPVTGVRHLVKDGETISAIAKKYGLASEDDIENILEYNEIEIEDFIQAGDEIIIPNGEKKVAPSPQRRQYLADLRREDLKQVFVPATYQGGRLGLIWPLPAARRLSQRFWSRHRGIDVPCRDCPVIASDDGIVELSGWQRGYGYTIVINHGGGIRTRYGHAKQLLVSAGDSVARGQSIMISGSTGRSTGPHLHFEIIKNGVHINPLGAVQ